MRPVEDISNGLSLLMLTCREQFANLIDAKLRDNVTPLINSLAGNPERVRELADRVVEVREDVAGFHHDAILGILRIVSQACLVRLLVAFTR